jgi:hypothetical protein
VVISNNYSSSEVLPYLRIFSGFDFASFCTADEVIGTPAERDRYARSSHGQVIEMETSAVAEIVGERELPFVALRVISDDYQKVLPVQALEAGFDAARGRSTPFRLLLHLALHWGDVGPFITFVKNLSLARRNLTSFLQQLNQELPRTW